MEFYFFSLHKILFVLLKLFKGRGFVTYLAHLKQIGVFDKISGLLIGIFTKIGKEIFVEELFELVQEYIASSLAVAKTQEVGHAKNSKALKIGEKIYIKNELIYLINSFIKGFSQLRRRSLRNKKPPAMRVRDKS